MPAQIGNKYWQFRGKNGANFKYDADSLWNQAVEYFDWVSEKVWNKKEAIKSGEMAGVLIDIPTSTPMSIEGFCLFADLVRQTFINYEKGDDKDLMEVATRIRQIIENQQFEGATVGAFNPSIIARKLGLTEKTDITSGGEKIETVRVFELPSNGR